MSGLDHVRVETMDAHRFASVITSEAYDALLELIEGAARELKGRVIWNVNSTAKGGGVAELLGPLLGYSRGAGVDARWVVISGGPEFFTVTKRLHNALHGFDGDGGPLGDEERAIYEETLRESAAELSALMCPADVVILHDPQTAGMVEPVRRTGATVIWRCHVGADRPNDRARAAWGFLRPYVLEADAYVFSREAFAWEDLDEDKLAVIPPSVDAFAPKNADQSREQTLAILARAGLVDGAAESGRRRRPGLHALGRYARARGPQRRGDRGGAADARRPARRPGVPLGWPQRPARSDPGLCRACPHRARRSPDAGGPVGRVRVR